MIGHRPKTPNAHWLTGEAARIANKPRIAPYARLGSRWEWEAGWDYADALRTEEPPYEPPSHQRGAGDGTVTPPDRCSLCACALNDEGLCVDTLCPGSREDDDDYYRRINA